MTVQILGAPTSPVPSGTVFTLTAKGADGVAEIPAHQEVVHLEGTASVGGGTPTPWSNNVTVDVPAIPAVPGEIVHVSSVSWVGGGGAVGAVQNNDTNAPTVQVTVP